MRSPRESGHACGAEDWICRVASLERIELGDTKPPMREKCSGDIRQNTSPLTNLGN